MEQQLSFFGPEASSGKRNSLFTAFLPSESTMAAISESRASLLRQHGALGKLGAPEKFHVTLVFVKEYQGDIPASEIRKASEACMAASRVASFPISLDHVESWGPTLVLSAIESPALMEFQASLLKQMILHGLPCKGNPKFNPHLTVSRGSKEIPSQPIEPITWEAGEVVLIQSLIGEGRYIHLGRWPLSGPP